MVFKHTPAPWKYTVRNANEIMTTFHGVTIGDVYLDITTSNQKSDAHLIAAAPELLEALIELIQDSEYSLRIGHEKIIELGGDCDSPELMINNNSSLNKAKLAIAKALSQQ
ncbi:hypothetical protein [Providencia rustigianii]|uniref:hypothetical protein n=1 Tax=Providencia rustigianii TaxID=158850 RepID=UPI002244E655|nr:hypothetical protein [Providencia rustigianii]